MVVSAVAKVGADDATVVVVAMVIVAMIGFDAVDAAC